MTDELTVAAFLVSIAVLAFWAGCAWTGREVRRLRREKDYIARVRLGWAWPERKERR